MWTMTNTPVSERTFIAFFGCVNAGKSSLVNKVTNQPLSIVSDTEGTTTDPVIKSMELLPIGPVSICDTAGLNDMTELGKARLEKTYEILRKADIAVVVIDGEEGISEQDEKLISEIKAKNIPYIICFNKCDVKRTETKNSNEVNVSGVTGEGVEELKSMLAAYAVKEERQIVSDLFKAKDTVILVTPIDEAAPKGRLILPQQLTLRELLDIHAKVMIVQPEELSDAISSLSGKVAAVITDSQSFDDVKGLVPDDIYLTSFSILMQRYKGTLDVALAGLDALDKLEDGDLLLVSEGCTHHRQCKDIGTVKLPGWITKYTGKNLKFEFTQGGYFPKDLSPYKMVVHCGGCMLNTREMLFRQNESVRQGVPFTNYGLLIAHINGILKRSIAIFDKI